jgi:hypothetical protein
MRLDIFDSYDDCQCAVTSFRFNQFISGILSFIRGTNLKVAIILQNMDKMQNLIQFCSSAVFLRSDIVPRCRFYKGWINVPHAGGGIRWTEKPFFSLI